MQKKDSWNHGEFRRGSLFELSGILLEVLEKENQITSGDSRLFLEVVDLAKVYLDLKSYGLQCIIEPKTFPWGHRECMFKEPGGNNIKFFERVVP